MRLGGGTKSGAIPTTIPGGISSRIGLNPAIRSRQVDPNKDGKGPDDGPAKLRQNIGRREVRTADLTVETSLIKTDSEAVGRPRTSAPLACQIHLY